MQSIKQVSLGHIIVGEVFERKKKGLEIEYGSNAINTINSPTILLICIGSL
jgi:hypothetical protein